MYLVEGKRTANDRSNQPRQWELQNADLHTPLHLVRITKSSEWGDIHGRFETENLEAGQLPDGRGLQKGWVGNYCYCYIAM